MLTFVYEKPALLSGKALAIADLHFGVERELAAKGIRMGSMTNVLLKDIGALIEETDASTLVILGDVKHAIASLEHSEQLELRAMMKELCGMAKVVVVPGNHDGELARMVDGVEIAGSGVLAGGDLARVADGVEIAGSDGIKIGDVAFCHGHAWPDEKIMGADELVMGHTHPCVELNDKFGGKSVERAWLIAKADATRLRRRYPKANAKIRLVLVPAFNPLVGGKPLNKAGAAMGPLLRAGMFKLGEGQIHILNGVGLGKLSSLCRKRC